MVKVIEFRPRETTGKRRTYEKAADVIPMPAKTRKKEPKPAEPPSLADMMGLPWPHATD